MPPLRACTQCIDAGVQCVRVAILFLTTDCEQGNKTALENITQSKRNGTLPAEFIFVPSPDAVHVGKSLKAGFANWHLMLNKERASLAIIHTLRDADSTLQSELPLDAVKNKDRMDFRTVVSLTKPSVITSIEEQGQVVHTVFPDKYRPSLPGQEGLCNHPVSIEVSEHGHLLVLDYDKETETSQLLDIRLHVPANVALVKAFPNSRCMVYLNGLVYVCDYNQSIHVHPQKKIKTNVAKMKKRDLQSALEELGKSADGTISILRERLSHHFQRLINGHETEGHDLDKVILSQNVLPSCIAKALPNRIIVASDTSRSFYSVNLMSDGVAINGDVHEICNYPKYCHKVKDMCVTGHMLYASYHGLPGGILIVNMDTHDVIQAVNNDSNECEKCSGVTVYKDGVAFTDVGARQIKYLHGNTVDILAGSGCEGDRDGPVHSSAFKQITGLVAEFDKNIFVVDSQQGKIKLITATTGICSFLGHLGMLYRAFSVHLKHQRTVKLSIAEATDLVKALLNYLKTTVFDVQQLLGNDKVTNGPEGTVAYKTVYSVEMIYNGLVELGELLHKVNPSFVVDLETCITIAVENVHALGHFKEQTQTQLQYARNLANTVMRASSVQCHGLHITSRILHHITPFQIVGFPSAICQLSHHKN
jgi:hypothetical protein